MKIFNLTTLTIFNLLNNVLRNLIVAIVNCFYTTLNNTTLKKIFYKMDNQDMEEQQPEDQQQEELQRLQDQQQLVAQLMEQDISDIDEDDDDEDDENDYIFSSNDDEHSSDENLISVYIAPSEKFNEPHGYRSIFQKPRHPPIAEYTFKPLHLTRVLFKNQSPITVFPSPRSGHRVIASDANLYSLGGYNPRSGHIASRHGQCRLFQELWKFNFAKNKWKLELHDLKNNEMPRELASNALVMQNNVLISHGGTGYPFGDSCSNDCYVYTVGKTPTVTRIKVTGDLPVPLYGPGIVIHEHYLYTIGGTTGFDYSCDVYRLNLRTKVWENVYICRPEMRDDPEGRYRHEVVYDGHHIYILGGGTSNTVYDLQRIPAFNLSSNSWDYFDTLPDRTLLPTQSPDQQPADIGFPKPRKCLSCVQHILANGDIEAFITGGLQGDYTTYFSDIWKINFRTKQWTLIRTATLPKPLYFHSAAHANNGCMYIFGGIENSSEEMRRRNTLYKMWMTIPKLSEICWDAITYYNRDLGRCTDAKLLGAGIPQRFVERLH